MPTLSNKNCLHTKKWLTTLRGAQKSQATRSSSGRPLRRVSVRRVSVAQNGVHLLHWDAKENRKFMKLCHSRDSNM